MEGQVYVEQLCLVLEDIQDELHGINWVEHDLSLLKLALLYQFLIKNVVDEANKQIELRNDVQNKLARFLVGRSQEQSLEDHEHR